MIELYVVYRLCRKLGQIAARKARRQWPYQLLLIGVWFGCEVIGMVSCLAILGEEQVLVQYLAGLGLAVIGSIVTFRVVEGRPSLEATELTQVFD